MKTRWTQLACAAALLGAMGSAVLVLASDRPVPEQASPASKGTDTPAKPAAEANPEGQSSSPGTASWVVAGLTVVVAIVGLFQKKPAVSAIAPE